MLGLRVCIVCVGYVHAKVSTYIIQVLEHVVRIRVRMCLCMDIYIREYVQKYLAYMHADGIHMRVYVHMHMHTCIC